VANSPRWAKVATQAAIQTPASIKTDVVDKVLEMASKGDVPLTVGERKTLEGLAALRQIQQADEDRSTELRLNKSHSIAYDIQFGDNAKGDFESLSSHQQAVASAVRQGDLNGATAKLKDLMLLAQHMNNKVAATNANLALNEGRGGSKTNTTPYRALGQQTRKFFEQKQGMWVNPIAPDSVRFSQRVAEDARATVALANHLAAIHPELGVEPIELVQLDESLQAPAEQVRRTYKTRNAEKIAATQKSEPLAQERTQSDEQPAQELNNDNANTATEKPPVSAETGAADAVAGDTRQRVDAAAKSEAGVAAETPDIVEKTNEPDTPKVEEKSEVVEDQPKSESEASSSPVDGSVDELDGESAASTVKLTSLEQIFPKLFATDKLANKFLDSFKLPGKPISRLLGMGDQLLNTVFTALKSMDGIRDFAGADNRFFQKTIDDKVLADYRRYIRLAGPMMAVMHEQLQAFVGKNADKIAEGVPANSWVNGKALNLTEQSSDGISYNLELLQGAVMAGLHWMLIANSAARNQDREDIAKRLGIDIADVPSNAPAYFNSGYPNVTSKRQLAQLIRRFWGVKEADDALIGNSEGIIEAMAGEILDALTDERVNLLKRDEPLQIGKLTVQRMLPVRDSEAGQLIENLKQTKADLLEKLVMIEPEETLFIGSPPTKIAAFQMGSSMVRTTKQQRELIDRYQKVPFKINPRMVDLYESLTPEQFVSLFGAPAYDPATTNINYAKSLDGQRITAASSYDTFKELLGQVRQNATEQGQSPAEVEVFYDYGVSAVGRLHMLGRNNPQASKILREIILPTHATIDLADTEQRTIFLAAVAQHLGIKIHQTGLANIEQLVTDKMAKLEGSLAVVEKKKFSPEDLEILRSELGNDLTPGALHALQDYVRFTQHDDKSGFDTALYLEADGITDGPINAMVHMGSGPQGSFTANWVNTVAKGGLMIGQRNSNTFAEQYAQDPIDLYTAVKNELVTALDENVKRFEGHPHFAPINTALRNVMAGLLKDMEWGADGTLIINRGLTKNPVTVIVYGSGAKGIAGKIVAELMDEVYQRMCSTTGQAEVIAVGNEINALTQHRIRNGKQGLFVEANPADQSKDKSFVKFTFTRAQQKNLENLVQHLFVGPMVAAMNSVIGESKPAIEAMRDAVQIQSIFLKHAFQDDLSSILEGRENRNDLLTRREIKQAQDRLKHMAPFVHTGTQSFFIAGSDKVDIRDPKNITKAKAKGTESRDPEFGRAFSDNFRSSAYVEGPINAGVKAAPTMVIGPGDGQMIQNYGTDPASKNGLPVFDGYNLSITDAKSGSASMNKAVFDGWQGNPLQAVAESFSDFVASADFSNISEEMLGELSRVLMEDGEGSVDSIVEAIRYRAQELTELALVQQARKNVLADTTLSVDHMAGAEAPHVNRGSLSITDTDPAAIADALNEKLDAELVKLRGDRSVEVNENIATELANLGELSETSGARTANMTEVRRMARKLKIPSEHRKLLDATLRQLQESDYRLTTGTLEQINADRIANGKTPLAAGTDKTAHGFTLAVEKQVYLISPTSETLVHELVHAATFDRVFAFYNDPASLSTEQKDAVTRIEAMMTQWVGHALENGERALNSIPLQNAYRDALRAIQGHLAKGNKAAALNEFMAWNLANRELIGESQKISIVGTIAEIAKNVLEAIKTLVWGKLARSLAPAIANDLYSNLRFNTEVLMNSAPTIEQKITDAEAILEHATAPAGIERLKQVRALFGQKIAQVVTAQAGPAEASLAKAEILHQLGDAVEVVDIIRTDFPMSQLASSTFRNIVLSLMVDTQLNPNALVRLQQLYSSTMKELKVESFLADPDTATDADRYYAQRKLNALRGLHGTRQDRNNRSSLMASFLGLAIVDDGFRSVLSKLSVPKSEKNIEGTLDAVLENFGQSMMDHNNVLFSGEGRLTPSIQAAVDALQEKLTEDSVNNAGYVDQFVTKVGETTDTFNDTIVNSVKNVTEALYDKLDGVETGARNRLIAALAKYGKALVSIVNEDKSEIVANGISSALNQSEIPTVLRELWAEIAGRTQSNKTIYDMIKAVRTFVQQTRQQFREHLPKLIAKHFSRELEDGEWSAMYHGLARTDLASLAQGFSVTRLLDILTRPTSAQREINKLEEKLSAIDPASWPLWQSKAEQLADYMTHGYPGRNLLRNAHAVANLYGELTAVQRKNFTLPNQATITMIDQLVSLYAVKRLDPAVAGTLTNLVDNEVEGMTHVMSFLVGQRKDEMTKVDGSPLAAVNHFKGYVPTEQEGGVSLVVADDRQFSDLRKRGYVRVGPYQGSNAERNAPKKSYYYAPVSGRAMFMQGIMQNVRVTAYGVDPRTGIANGPATAGAITNVGQVDVRHLRNQGGEPLMPIYDSAGDVVGYERSIDPLIAAKLNPNTQMHEVLGIWHGRQAEEKMASVFNETLIERLGDQWRREKGSQKSEYVNLFSREAQQDAVIKDAVSLMTADARESIEAQFGRGNFWVRRDLINDALGYRSPSVSDLWTGISRWSPEVQQTAQNVAMGILGKDAFKMLVRAEQTYQTFVSDAKVTIVVKSVVVPIANMLSNVYHLAGRGVPLKSIVKGFPGKAAEVDFFIKNRLRRMELQAQLRSAEGTNNLSAQHEIKAELKSILDSNRRLSIWPLIEAGEFASISDAGITNEEIELTEGRLGAYIEKLTDKLPDGLKTAAKYGMVSRDTALFKGLQRAVEYGDFLAKAVLYDDLTKRQGKSHEYALGKVTEEFINYDRQPGRWRSGLENNGLMWFWNFKLRSAKVALSVLRNNPLHLLLAGLAPTPEFLGIDVGTPVTDNFVSVIADSKQGWSIGLDQGLRAHLLNPWVNLVS
jgi:hypothetical protein